MALDRTGTGENVEQPQRVEAPPPPPPPDRPGTPGSPSRAESRAAAQDNGQPQADQPKEQSGTSPPDSTDRERNEPEGGQGQAEASPALDQGDPAEQQDTRTTGGSDSNAGEAPDSPPDRQREPADQSNEQIGDDSASDQILGGKADSGSTADSPDATGDLENVDQDQVENSVDAKRPSDGLPTATEEQSTGARRESSDQSATETEPKRADNDTAQDNRPEENAPDQPLHRHAQETQQPTSESPDPKPDLPKPDTDSPGPTETPENQTPTSDQPEDPQTPPLQAGADSGEDSNSADGADGLENAARPTYDFKVDGRPLREHIDPAMAEQGPDKTGDQVPDPTDREGNRIAEQREGDRATRRRKFQKDVVDFADAAGKAGNDLEQAASKPPIGHAETGTPSAPDAIGPPHQAPNLADAFTSLAVVGLMGYELIVRTRDRTSRKDTK